MQNITGEQTQKQTYTLTHANIYRREQEQKHIDSKHTQKQTNTRTHL